MRLRLSASLNLLAGEPPWGSRLRSSARVFCERAFDVGELPEEGQHQLDVRAGREISEVHGSAKRCGGGPQRQGGVLRRPRIY